MPIPITRRIQFVGALLTAGLVYAGLAFAQAAEGTTPSIESLLSAPLSSSPWALLAGLIVKWFMGYTETKDKVFLETIKTKDDAFTKLAEECHAHMRTQNSEILQTLKELSVSVGLEGGRQHGGARDPH